jgi:hypothetical protein
VAFAELELASVITTVWAPPAVEVGTVKVAPENEPVAFVLVMPLSVIGDPAYVAVIVFEAAKPEPDTVTIEPALPLVGFREIDGVTVNVAFAAFERASIAVTFFPPAV